MWIINILVCLLYSFTSDCQEIKLVSWFRNFPKSIKCNRIEIILQSDFGP